MACDRKNNLKSNTKGSIMWLINDRCNYNCSYCLTQARLNNSKEAVDNYELFLKNFKKKIPRGWNFFIGGGGEPTIHPDFFKIVEGLVENGYNISLITNLSMSFERIDRFFDKAKDRCVFFTASLHLEEVDFDEFYSKVIYIRDNYLYNGELDVSSVAIPSKLDLLKDYSKFFSRENISFRAQYYKNRREKGYAYSAKEFSDLKQINKNNVFKNSKTSKSCLCGFKYAVMNPHGEVFRCTSAMRHKDSMGNILDQDFGFYKNPEFCFYKSCLCGDNIVADFFSDLNNGEKSFVSF